MCRFIFLQHYNVSVLQCSKDEGTKLAFNITFDQYKQQFKSGWLNEHAVDKYIDNPREKELSADVKVVCELIDFDGGNIAGKEYFIVGVDMHHKKVLLSETDTNKNVGVISFDVIGILSNVMAILHAQRDITKTPIGK